MKIAITDANIFIDLIKLQMLGFLFSIELEIYTTLEIINELKEDQKEFITGFIQSNQLNIYHFSADEWEEILAIPGPAGLTREDMTVVYLARKMEAAVLSGDNPLRKFCKKQELEVKGIIWLFDQFLHFNLVTHVIAIERMNHLLSFNNRLPQKDCEHRLKEWRSTFE